MEIDEVVEVEEGSLFWDREGKPLGIGEFGKLKGDKEYAILARSAAGDTEVITAWLGTDQGNHWIDPLEEPLIFGTIELRGGEYFNEEFSASEEEAMRRHEARVAGLRGGG